MLAFRPAALPHLLWALAILGLPPARGHEVSFERIQLSDEFYSEGGTYGDYNADGQGDVAVGPWIYYGPSFEQKSRFYAGEAFAPAGYSANFLMYTRDVNADQRPDILVLGFPGKESWWYENPGPTAVEQLWEQHVIHDSVDNESPLIADVDGDGIDDLVCSSRGCYGYATHAGREPREPWRFVNISPNNGYQRYTHGLGIGDVNNDGLQDLMEKDGWWQNPGQAVDGEAWAFHPFVFSPTGGAQMIAVDLDGDGRNEVVSGLAAHGFGLVYYRASNAAATQFERLEIMTDDPQSSPVGMAVSQLHAMDIGDVNGDGIPDLVTGKRWWAHANHDPGHSQPATLLWLETVRGPAGRVRFLPHVVDTSSGVGTQVTVGDVNGDGLPDIVSGSKRGAYLFLQRPADLPAGQYLVPAAARADRFGQRPAVVEQEREAAGDTFVPAVDGRPLNFDFESGVLQDWEIRGSIAPFALMAAPANAPQELGKQTIDTGSEKPEAVGELISRPFKLTRSKLSFLLGGSSDPETRVELVAESSAQVLHAATAEQDAAWHLRTFDAGQQRGQMVRLRIVDHSAEGYLRVDDFHLHD